MEIFGYSDATGAKNLEFDHKIQSIKFYFSSDSGVEGEDVTSRERNVLPNIGLSDLQPTKGCYIYNQLSRIHI